MSYKRAKRLSTFRRIALAMWGPPHDGTIYGTTQVDITKALAYVEKLERETGVTVSLGVLAGRAVALAYADTPHLNGKVIWGTIYQKDDVDVYYQVDLGQGSDLGGVVVRAADKKTPVEIVAELRGKAKKLRDGEDVQYERTQKGLLGKLPPFLIRWLMIVLVFLEYNLGLGFLLSLLGAAPDPFGTVMVSNVSRFGIDVAYAPLPPLTRVPSVIVVGQQDMKALVIDGEVVPRPCVNLSGTFDHRFADGNKIGRINRLIDAYMEDPEEHERCFAESQKAKGSAAQSS